MFKPGDRVRVQSPDGKMNIKGILIGKKDDKWWKLTVTDPGDSIYETGQYISCPVMWIKKA